MKASRKSLHAWLYKFTYTSDLPKNLCPYFWKLLWAIVVFIPNAIIQLSARIVDLFEKSKYGHDCREFRHDGGFAWCIGILIGIYIDSTYHWIRAMIRCYSYDQALANTGMVANMLIFLGLLLILGAMREENSSIKKAKKPSIIGEFIRAKYNKICPKIDWEE